MKVLIIGGAGFIGYHLAKKYLDNNHNVEIIDNFSRASKDSEIIHLSKNKNCKINNLDLINKKIKLSSNFDIIYNLAAIVGVKNVNKSPELVLKNNYLILLKSLEIAEKQKSLKKFFFMSTSEIYAGTLEYFGLKFPTKENTPITISNIFSKRTTYMLSKIHGEVHCINKKNLPYIIVRPHNIYGPRMGYAHVIPELIKKIKKGSKPILIKSSNHSRTFCYIDDAIDILYKVSKSKYTKIIFNLGSDDKCIQIFSLAKKISKILNKKIKLIKSINEIGSPFQRIPDIKFIKKNFKTKFVKIDEGLLKTYNWYRKKI